MVRFLPATAWLVLLLVSSAGANRLAEGDLAWFVRADGQVDGRAAAEPVDRMLAGYERELLADPQNLEVRWKLLRAFHYAGDFSDVAAAQAQEFWDRATRIADESVALAFGREGSPDVARVHFWAGVVWGRWSRDAGVIATVREGVANRIHDYTRVAMRLDPGIDDGGPYRVLCHLHAELPRIPLLSGWVDRSKALPLIEKAYAAWPSHPGNSLMLATTLRKLAPERADEAERLLRQAADSVPREDRLVEDLSIRKEARRLLEVR